MFHRLVSVNGSVCGGNPVVLDCEILSKDLADALLNSVIMLWLVEGNGCRTLVVLFSDLVGR